MLGEVRVLLFNATTDAQGIEAAYHQVSAELVGVPGLLGNELLRSVHDTRQFIVMSRWESMAAFETWERGTDHRSTTTPLRSFRDLSLSNPFGVYQVSAEYHRREGR